MSNYTVEEKQALIDWVRGLMESKGWSAPQLAIESGLAPSTILLLFSDVNLKRFQHSTLLKIADAAEAEVPEIFRRKLH
jgi:transcriptional regulator with XRE-family HTH domain